MCAQFWKKICHAFATTTTKKATRVDLDISKAFDYCDSDQEKSKSINTLQL